MRSLIEPQPCLITEPVIGHQPLDWNYNKLRDIVIVHLNKSPSSRKKPAQLSEHVRPTSLVVGEYILAWQLGRMLTQAHIGLPTSRSTSPNSVRQQALPSHLPPRLPVLILGDAAGDR